MSSTKKYYEEFNFRILEQSDDDDDEGSYLNQNQNASQDDSFASQSLDESSDGVPSKIVQLWSDGATRFLLDQYAVNLSQIGPLKKFKNKKAMWVEIGKKIGGKTWKQCEQRYKTVMKRKKYAVENNTTSGAKRQNVQFQEELEKIAKLDDSIEPEKISSQKKIVKFVEPSKEVRKEEIEAMKKTKPKTKTVQETMIDIFNKKEEAKERRHKEKMDRAERIENLLLKISEK